MQTPPLDEITLLQQRKPSEGGAKAESLEETRSGIAWWMWVATGVLFLAYAAVSLRLHERLLSNSYDLGIFDQAVRSYASGHLPVSELKGPGYPLLGDHFHPVLALLAPFYLLWPSAETLLVAQAALIAVSALPLAVWARRELGDLAAGVIMACYGMSWGIASAVGFDFHEVAFAAPLLAFSMAALGTGRLRAAVYWALPLLLVKEDLGITVAVIGLLVARRGDRKLGITTAVAGMGASILTVFVIIPAFNPHGTYEYWNLRIGMDGDGDGPLLLGLLYKVTVGLITPEVKATTLIQLLAPTLFLALRSPLLLVALPTIAWRFISSYTPYWGTGYHVSLTLMPIVFAAFIEALIRRRSNVSSVRRYVAGAAAVSLLLLPQYPLWELVQPATWRHDPRVAVAEKLMDRIPRNATVQASTYLVPHLTNRTSVSLYGWSQSRPDPEWIMVDTWVAPALRWPLDYATEKAMLDRDRAHGYRVAADVSGFVLLRRSVR